MRGFDPIKRGQSGPVLSSIYGLVMARTPVSHAEVFQYLSKANKYSEGCSDARKRSIRRFTGNIALENGTLFYLSKDKGQIHKRRWISDKKVQQEIIESVHDNVGRIL